MKNVVVFAVLSLIGCAVASDPESGTAIPEDVGSVEQATTYQWVHRGALHTMGCNGEPGPFGTDCLTYPARIESKKAWHHWGGLFPADDCVCLTVATIVPNTPYERCYITRKSGPSPVNLDTGAYPSERWTRLRVRGADASLVWAHEQYGLTGDCGYNASRCSRCASDVRF